MTETILIIPALPCHVSEIKTSLRTEDAAEIMRWGISVSRGIWGSFRHRYFAKTAFVDGKIAAMWGVNGAPLGTGIVWLVTSPQVRRISPLKFCRIYQQEVHAMLRMFSKLENWVDDEYKSAIRLLEITGFHIDEPKPTGAHGALFRHFHMKRA